MNKKQINHYLKESIDLQADLDIGNTGEKWESKVCQHFKRFPKKLFKYVKLNRNTFDSIRKNYVYLCPANKLDDQFECQVRDPSFEEYKELENDKELLNVALGMLPEQLKKYPMLFSKDQLMTILEKCSDGDFSMKKIISIVEDMGFKVSDEEKRKLEEIGSANFEKTGEETAQNIYSKVDRLKEETGVGSLAESNKSQVMWEMYAKNYKGICIEYNLSDDFDSMRNTFPVRYMSKRNINLLKTILGLTLDSYIFGLSKGSIKVTESLQAYIEILLTKYKEWSFQKEWRIIGKPKHKFKVPKIKRIYVGKNISEENYQKLCQIADEQGIELYGQFDDFNTLEIDFVRIR